MKKYKEWTALLHNLLYCHKKIFDNDLGPNTGGMGAYAPVPFIKKEMINRIEKEIIAPTIKALREHDNPYTGILYPGLILTADGPKVLEYNCRFGDPETQPVLSLLKTDIIDLFEAIINKKLKNYKLKWSEGAAVCVVLAAKGYPGSYEKGHVINFTGAALANSVDKLQTDDVSIFHAGTKTVGGKIVSSSGRVLSITAKGTSIKKAINKVYKYLGKNSIHFSGMYYRKDIGQKGLNKKLWRTLI